LQLSAASASPPRPRPPHLPLRRRHRRLVHGHVGGFLRANQNRPTTPDRTASPQADKKLFSNSSRRNSVSRQTSSFPIVEDMLNRPSPKRCSFYTNTFDHRKVVRGLRPSRRARPDGEALAVSNEDGPPPCRPPRSVEKSNFLVNYETDLVTQTASSRRLRSRSRQLHRRSPQSRRFTTGHTPARKKLTSKPWLSFKLAHRSRNSTELAPSSISGCYGADLYDLASWTIAGRIHVTAVTQRIKPDIYSTT